MIYIYIHANLKSLMVKSCMKLYKSETTHDVIHGKHNHYSQERLLIDPLPDVIFNSTFLALSQKLRPPHPPTGTQYRKAYTIQRSSNNIANKKVKQNSLLFKTKFFFPAPQTLTLQVVVIPMHNLSSEGLSLGPLVKRQSFYQLSNGFSCSWSQIQRLSQSFPCQV